MALHTLQNRHDGPLCCAMATPEDVVLIMDAAIYSLDALLLIDWPCPLYVLAADCTLAGIETVPEAVVPIEISDWVKLTEQHRQHIAWY